MMNKKDRRPGGLGTTISDHVDGRSVTSLADLTSRARRRDHGILVLAERADGVVTGQVFANLGAAEAKVWRTRARGLEASMQLVRLVPIHHITLDELGGDAS